MAVQFSGRQKPKTRPLQSPYSAPVDTSGMDPDMIKTLSAMRGPAGSIGPTPKIDPWGGLKSMLAHLFGGKK